MATPLSTPDRPRGHDARFDARECCSADGLRTYRVQVGVPEGEVPAAGYPALFLLDGDLLAKPLADALTASGEPIVVVLISHAPMGARAREARAWDYTPAIPGRDPLDDPRQPAWRNGGADDFLALVNDVIVPAVLADHPIDRSRLTLYGHSYGALCVLRAVQARHTPAFTRYVAASPSVWWHDGAIFAQYAVTRSPQHADVLVMAGTLEAWHAQPVGSDGSPASREGGTPTLPVTYRLARQWADSPDLNVVFEAIEGGTHHSMLAQSIPPAIAFAGCTQAAIDAARLRPDLLETPF
ncbi:alpha/beta hydrolase-fold protein [Alcaligenaceae bacterium A4P071]|nr:alpha/beta hydrolase-fold protein [Alcaligenaceae bacterium A4P071]